MDFREEKKERGLRGERITFNFLFTKYFSFEKIDFVLSPVIESDLNASSFPKSDGKSYFK